MSALSGSLNPSNTLMGHSQLLNQVSTTSSSCLMPVVLCPAAANWAMASASVRHTATSPSALYQAGMRCPHQSWRLMHQSRTFSIQWR